MIDLKKISNLTAFYCGSDCEEFAKKCNSINEFVANAKAEWLLSIAEEIGKQFIGMFVAVQNQEKYDEIRKKIVLALIDCALLESDRYSDEQLDLLWVAEEWAKGNVHKDDFDGAFSKAYQAWDWCDVRDYHLKKSTLQLYNSSRLIWLVFRNQNHDGLILYIKEVNREDNGKEYAEKVAAQCAEICREFLGELIIKHYNNV